MKFRKVLGLTLAGTILASTMVASAEYNPDKVVTGPITTLSVDNPQDSYKGMSFVLVVNEKGLNPEKGKVYIQDDGTIMLPLRAVSEALGYEVTWNNEEKTVELKNGPNWIMVKIGEDYYSFGKMAPMKLGTAAELSEERSYVPINFVTDLLKGKAMVDETGVVNIKTDKASIEKESLLGIEGEIKRINKTEKNTMLWVEGNRIFDGYNDAMVLNVNENTKLVNPVTNEELSIEDLKEGDRIRGFYGPAVTRSIPPHGNAEKIQVLKDVAVKTGIITEIINNDKTSQILVGDLMDGMKLNITEETKIVTKDDKELTFKDLKKGMEVEAFHSLIMTMSIPPISSAKKIVVKEMNLEGNR